jgi:hypothetical protein
MPSCRARARAGPSLAVRLAAAARRVVLIEKEPIPTLLAPIGDVVGLCSTVTDPTGSRRGAEKRSAFRGFPPPCQYAAKNAAGAALFRATVLVLNSSYDSRIPTAMR